MFRPRVIPVLLLKGKALVKTRRFRDPTYIGDPVNAVRIFNELKADELVFLDVLASREGRTVPLDFVRRVGEEAAMPFAVGGGIRTVEEIRAVLGAGAEKVVLNTHAATHPDFIREAADAFGSSTIVVCMDVKSRFGRLRTWIRGGTRATGHTPEAFAHLAEEMGAGELVVQSMARDGTMEGYDLELVARVSRAVTIPVVALGGAGSVEDLRRGWLEGHASGLAAGSLFVYQGKQRGVLINYPRRGELGS
ncbi:MAG: imidazole glycerol phosphate synthase subunit HisF [Gemmatimonadota bacterium]